MTLIPGWHRSIDVPAGPPECSRPIRAPVIAAKAVSNGGHQREVVLSAACPHCQGSVLLDQDSARQAVAQVGAEGRARSSAYRRQRLADIMRTNVPTVGADASLDVLVRVFGRGDVTHVVAVDALHRPEGVAVPERLLALVGERGLDSLGAVSVRAAFSSRVVSLLESDPLDVAAHQLALRDVECAIVASVEGRFRGLITASELLGWSLATSS